MGGMETKAEVYSCKLEASPLTELGLSGNLGQLVLGQQGKESV